MSSTFINHNILQSYYTFDDMITTNIYEKCAESSDAISCHINNDHIIINIRYYADIAIGFNIKSVKICDGYLCVNRMIISSFCISKGKKFYPHLVLLYMNYVTLILDKCCIIDVEMVTVDRSQFDLVKNYRLPNDNFEHRIIKVNEFSPHVVYHNCNMCNHTYWCSFDNYYKSYDVGAIHDIKNIDPIIISTKIVEICQRVIQLLNFEDIVEDILVYIGIMMCYIV